MAVWIFFLSPAPTAQNSQELKIHIRNVAQDTSVDYSGFNPPNKFQLLSFYHLFFAVLTFYVFPIFAKIVYQKVVFEIRAINIKQTIQFFPMQCIIPESSANAVYSKSKFWDLLCQHQTLIIRLLRYVLP